MSLRSPTEEAAEAVLARCGILTPDEIDVRAIAAIHGIAVRTRQLTGCEARIIGLRGRAIITVNRQASEQRRRFSVAHELGHWFLDRERGLLCAGEDIETGRSEGGARLERRANEFAAALLMPRRMLAEMRLNGMTFNEVDKTADVFNVSRTAAALRVVEMGMYAGMLLKFDVAGRLQWFLSGPAVPARFFPVRALAEETQAARILRGSSVTGGEESCASLWFTFDGADEFDVVEETVRTCDGALTLLWWHDEEQLVRVWRELD